jgi:CDP-diglyceride synthetase
MATRLQKILKRTLVGGSLVVVLALVMRLAYGSEGGLAVWATGAVLAIGSTFEVARMSTLVPRSLVPGLWVGLLLALAPGVLHYLLPGALDTSQLYATFPSTRGVAVSYLAGTAGVVLTGLVASRGRVQPGLALGLGVWLLAPLPAIVLVWQRHGPDGLLALVILSKIGDIFGYYAGSALGRTHPFPRISPGKTTAGCVASLVAGTLAGGACVGFGLLPGGREAITSGLVAGALVNLASQAGDLLESLVKRRAGVKDSGTWFGPSGGVLDLVDSLLLSVPVALLAWPWLLG